jgi:aldehyde:ferredoxin oxidoreductase
MYGWTGRVLEIDLSNKTTRVVNPDKTVYEKYIGGKGLAGYYLKPFVTRHWTDSKMPLLFFTGPLNNTSSPTSGRMTVLSKSPLTGTVGDTSVGGKLGTMLKRAGYDGIIITGKSDKYIGIHLDDNGIRFADATKYQGYSVTDTCQALDRLVPGASTAVIGPAAENQVMFASIVLDEHYFAGRGGLGCVMADKKLKFITVKGSQKTPVADAEELSIGREEIFRLVAASPVLMGDLGISNYGTGALYDLMRQRRMMPTDNFRQTYFESSPGMNAYAYKQKYKTRKFGCMGCHVLCKKKGLNNEVIPEFETMSHFSALICNDDLDAVVEANRICNDAGMDTISAAASIACYKEITGTEISPHKLIQLLDDIVAGKGDGALLGKGSRAYAEKLQFVDASMTVKGLEFPAYDPRGAYGMALAYATSTRGGCHLRAYPISHEILRKPVATDRFSFSGKARIIKISEDANAMIDSLTACKFLFFAASLEEYARVLQGVTGVQTTAQDLLNIGERIYYNDRIMNALNGFTASDDDLPPRFFKEPGSGNADFDVPALNRDEFLQERASYYKIRGLDENGLPTREKCEALELTCNA